MKNVIFSNLAFIVYISFQTLHMLYVIMSISIPKPQSSLVLTFNNSLLSVENLFNRSNIFNIKSKWNNLHEKKTQENHDKDYKHKAINKLTQSNEEIWHINYAGKSKHYPPANKEWSNSIYAYNNNTVKVLPSADKITSKLIKSYFNSYSRKLESTTEKAKPRPIRVKRANKAKKVKLERIRVKRARFSTNRMLASKAELKHTNDKVAITVYVYNSEAKHYLNTIKNIATIDQIDKFSYLGAWTLKEQFDYIASKANKYIMRESSTYDLDKFGSNGQSLDLATPYEIYMLFSKNFREGLYLNKFPKFLSAIKKRGKKMTIRETRVDRERLNRALFLKQTIPRIYPQLVNNTSNKGLVLKSKMHNHKKSLYVLLTNKGLKPDKSLFITKPNTHEKKYLADYVYKSLNKEINSVYYKQLMSFSKLKFQKRYAIPLIKQINKVYNKKVEFNFVNLKYLYLNSSIFSEALLVKVKNKKNKLLQVLKNSLLMFKLPALNRQAVYDEIYKKKMVIQNLGIKSLLVKPYMENSKNLTIGLDINNNAEAFCKPDLYAKNQHIANKFLNELIKLKDGNGDVLEKSLLNFIPAKPISTSHLVGYSTAPAPASGLQDSVSSTTLELQDSVYKLGKVMDSLKHKAVSGIRIEVAGRLTKRNTAARSVFKLKYKGNIRNTDSSDKGLSTVMLRGHAKPNLQYSRLKSKIRIGSFGLKGWVNSS